MHLPLQLQTFTVGRQNISLFVPQISAVQKDFEQKKKERLQPPFPYWAQVWPAALAMGEFLLQHPHYIQNKTVLELAGGLGLPSLLAAPFAQQVTCSDYMEEAVQVAQQSAQYNGLHNMHCCTLNWHHLPPGISAEVLLLSDVNYEPSEFDILYNIIEKFVEGGTTVIISTPQRLMAKGFISRLMPWCTLQQQAAIQYGGKAVPITIMTIQKV